MKLLHYIKDFIRDYPKHFLGTCLTLLIISAGGAFAAVSVDWNNLPQMYLENTVTVGQTANIKLATPQLNGEDWRYSTTTGGVLRFRTPNNFFTEDIYYTSATVNSDLTVTLSGVTRQLCENVSRAYVSCGDGYQWSAGTIVEYTVDSRNINMKANIDRVNTFTASGALRFSGSGSLTWPTFATTAERDRQLGSNPPPGNVRTACVTATGLCYMFIGGAWTAFGNTGVGAATIAALGTAELATVTDVKNHAITGDVGPLVLTTDITTRTSTGTTQANKIPALGTSGRMSGSLLGSGTTNSGTVLFGDGQWRNLNYFGTCADGDATITTGTTTTLTADKHYSNLTIQSGAYLKPAGYRIFVCNTLKVYGGGFIRANGSGGILANAGTAASGTTPGTGGAGAPAAHGAGTLPAPKAGVAGGAGGAALSCNGSNRNGSDGSVGTAGNAETVGIGSAAVAGGTGGAGGDGGGGTPGNGGAGGALGATSITDATVMFNALLQSLAGVNPRTFAGSGSGGGGGGGGGGASDAACASGNNGAGGGGGGSGSPGGNMDVFTRVLSGSGTIQANGGSGGDGGAGGGCGAGTNDGGGGGGNAGAPGNGGTIMLVYNLLSSWTGTIQALAGSAGTPGTAGSSGCEIAGAAGSAPTANAGQVFQYQVR